MFFMKNSNLSLSKARTKSIHEFCLWICFFLIISAVLCSLHWAVLILENQYMFFGMWKNISSQVYNLPTIYLFLTFTVCLFLYGLIKIFDYLQGRNNENIGLWKFKIAYSAVCFIFLVILGFSANKILPLPISHPASLSVDIGLLILTFFGGLTIFRVRSALIKSPYWLYVISLSLLLIPFTFFCFVPRFFTSKMMRHGLTSKKNNVLLIIVDTLRADHIGFLGGPDITPNLDQLARDSIVFQNAISPAPWTTPAVGSIFTGLAPRQLGFKGEGIRKIDRSFVTLSEIFRENGYETKGIISHIFVGPKLGFNQGFDSYDDSNALGHDHISSASITKKAISYIKSSRKPFFLFLHYFDPHYSFFMHSNYNYDPSYRGPIKSGTQIGMLLKMVPEMTTEDINHIKAMYQSEISHADKHLGNLFQALKKIGLYDRSLIVFVADHGEEFLERGDGWIGHERKLFQEQIHVPLLFKLPGNSKRGTVEEYVSTMDIAPTIIDSQGLHVPGGYAYPGKSFNLSGKMEQSIRQVVSETHRGVMLNSLIWNGWKLIKSNRTNYKRLYYLKEDPGESMDMKNSHLDILNKMEGKLDEWIKEVTETKNGPIIQKAKFNQEEIRRLKELGYIK